MNLLSKDEDDVHARYERGRALFDLGDFEGALAELKLVLAQDEKLISDVLGALRSAKFPVSKKSSFSR